MTDEPQISRALSIGKARSQKERELIAAYLELPPAEQLDFYALVAAHCGRDLSGSEPTPADERAQALEALHRAAEHLRLGPGVAPKARDFDRAARKLGLGWTARRVGLVFGRYRFAQEVLTGTAKAPSSAEERALQRIAVKLGPRTAEELIADVRAWLATDPAETTGTDFDRWRKAENRRRKAAGERGAPLADRLRAALALDWPTILRVARGEIALEQARAEVAERIFGAARSGPHDLLGIQEILEWLGRSYDRDTLKAMMKKPAFPRPALVKLDRRFWVRGDVEAFFAGKPLPSRTENELGPLYLTDQEAAKAAGLHYHDKTGRRYLPPPTVRLSRRVFWLRSEIEEWSRQRRGAQGRKRHVRGAA